MMPMIVSDPAVWNSILAKLPAQDVALDWRWGEHLSRTYGWKPLRLSWIGDGEPLAALQVHRFPFGLKKMAISSPFLTTGAICHRPGAAIAPLLSSLGMFAEQIGLRRIDVRDISSAVVDHGEFTFRLSLAGMSREKLLKSFDSKLRSQIKKPQKDGYVAERYSGKSLLFYPQFQRKMHEFGTPVHARSLLEGLLCDLPDVTRQLIIKDPDGAIIGGMLMLVCNQVATIPFAVVHETARRSAANMLLYWEALASACDEGITEIDFGRSQKDSGTYKFKLQWGSTPCPLVNRQCSKTGVIEADFGIRGDFADRFIDLWADLPRDIADRLGPRLRRFIP